MPGCRCYRLKSLYPGLGALNAQHLLTGHLIIKEQNEISQVLLEQKHKPIEELYIFTVIPAASDIRLIALYEPLDM